MWKRTMFRIWPDVWCLIYRGQRYLCIEFIIDTYGEVAYASSLTVER